MILLAELSGDIITEQLPLWQKLVPYLCLAYTLIVLWIASARAMLPYREGDARMRWLALIGLLPIVGALATLFAFRDSKFRNTPTVAEQKEADRQAALHAQQEQAKRDAEARDSFRPFDA